MWVGGWGGGGVARKLGKTDTGIAVTLSVWYNGYGYILTEVSHMAKMSAQALAAKWQAKFGASTEAYKAGVAAVTVAPSQSAIAAKDRWIANLNAAAAAGRYEAGLSKVTLSDWKAAATDKGAANMAAGARLGAIKVQQAEQRMGPIRDSIVQGLPPRGTLDQNIERASQMARQMAATKMRS